MSATVVAGGDASLVDAMVVMPRAFDACYGEAWTEGQCAGLLAMPGADLLVARSTEGNGASVGFALLRTVMTETELMLVAVVPEARRRGIARLLLDQAMTRARERGARRFLLEVRADNPALSIYRAAGLVAVGRRRDYYRGADGRLRDAITLARDL